MKRSAGLLALNLCLLLSSCGGLEETPEDLPALSGTEQEETAAPPEGSSFETLTVSEDPVTAEFSLAAWQEQAAFLYVTVEADTAATVDCTDASRGQPVTLALEGGVSWKLPGASEEAYSALWSSWPVTLQQGKNIFCIIGGGDPCRTRLELLDVTGVSYAGAFPEGTELAPLEGM